eukprot:15453931-Alexandrium_andersonii.AAC.1
MQRAQGGAHEETMRSPPVEPESELVRGALVELVRRSCGPVEFTWRSHVELMGSPRGANLWNSNEELKPSS